MLGGTHPEQGHTLNNPKEQNGCTAAPASIAGFGSAVCTSKRTLNGAFESCCSCLDHRSAQRAFSHIEFLGGRHVSCTQHHPCDPRET